MQNSMKINAGRLQQQTPTAEAVANPGHSSATEAPVVQKGCVGVFKAGLRVLTDPSILVGKLPTGADLLKKLS